MNTTASFSSEHSWSRRCSTETVFSIQGKETDIVRDTSDTSSLWSDDEHDAEYEPVTESEDAAPVPCDSSGGSDNEIIATKVIEVKIRDDGDLVFADSEQTESNGSDSEIDLHDYWYCAQCLAANNNPLYRYCEKCFKVRKNFFPPRPKRKPKRASPEPVAEPSAITGSEDAPARLSQDSAYESLASNCQSSQELGPLPTSSAPAPAPAPASPPAPASRKRRADSADRNNKRIRADRSESDSGPEPAEGLVRPLVKMVSDPLLTVAEPPAPVGGGRRPDEDACIVCLSRPKSGVFVHGRIAHICCCYDCALRVWARAKRCPVCNCKGDNPANLWNKNIEWEPCGVNTSTQPTNQVHTPATPVPPAARIHFSPQLRSVPFRVHIYSVHRSRRSRISPVVRGARFLFESPTSNKLRNPAMACSVSDAPSLKDLPKVANDLKSQLEGFNTSCLRDVDTNEKIVLPSAEDIAQEKQHTALLQDVEKFQPSNLRKTDTVEKVVLPNALDVAAEKTQKSLFDGIEKFDATRLKHTETQEKNPLPDKDAIEAEKEKNKFLNGIENFDPTKLKHTETCEKNPLPTKDIIEQEKTA
ncbi:unnamed protein product, partial [Iphiclides podalirius]